MPRHGRGRFHGYLVIDKPAGWTSHDVVAKVRRLTGERKVGHAGTLDPAATGVLPVAVGLATRSLEYLSESAKTYFAEVTFGVSTDTYDLDGSVVATGDPSELAFEQVVTAVDSMRGERFQRPPMFSAIRMGGERLYERARRGEHVEREARRIDIDEITIVRWHSPVLELCINCSKGTYIRSVASELGEVLGCGAFLSNLVRLRAGPFEIDAAWTLSELGELDLELFWERIAAHPDAALHEMPAIVIDGAQSADWSLGRPVGVARAAEGARVYNFDGDWLGIAEAAASGSAWHPRKVIPDAA